MKGRKQIPTELKLLQGGQNINYDSPKVRKQISDSAPDFLEGYARELWKKAVDECPAGMLASLDFATLASWCIAVEGLRDAVEQFRDEGKEYSIMGPNGMRRINPLAKAINTQTMAVLRTVSELGFSPVSRSKVKVEEGNHRKDTGAFSKFAS